MVDDRKVAMLDRRLLGEAWRKVQFGFDEGRSIMLLSCEAKGLIFDVIEFQPKFGAWMLRPGGFLEGGKFLMTSEIDPLFLALRILEGQSGNMYEPRVEVLACSELNMMKFCSEADLELLCQSQDLGDEKVFRFDENKATKWLKAKLALLEQEGGLSRQDALEVMSRYLSPKWQANLSNDISTSEKDVETAALLNYNNPAVINQTVEEKDSASLKTKSEPKPRRNKLAKVDTSAMRSLTSFFKKK